MTEHSITWYESEDGKIFVDEMECLDHELNLLYKKSGFTFYVGESKVKEIETEDDKTYNEMTDIYIDRSKKEENDKFIDLLHYNYGWCYIDEAYYESDGTHYKFIESAYETALIKVA